MATDPSPKIHVFSPLSDRAPVSTPASAEQASVTISLITNNLNKEKKTSKRINERTNERSKNRKIKRLNDRKINHLYSIKRSILQMVGWIFDKWRNYKPYKVYHC